MGQSFQSPTRCRSTGSSGPCLELPSDVAWVPHSPPWVAPAPAQRCHIYHPQFPSGTQPLAHQYAAKYGWDSYQLNPSWDLYGGGGIASTVKDAALFFQYLFEGKIIEDTTLLKELHQFVLPKEKSNYCLGFRNISFPTFTAYYHGGWWGTDVAYCPETNSSVAVFTLQKAQRGKFALLSIDFMKILASENLD